MRHPSVQRIESVLGLTRADAREIREFMECVERFEGADRHWAVYNQLSAIERVIGGHGIEGIPNPARTYEDEVSYVNMGDPYTPTVMWDCADERFRVGCWGDLIEKFPKRFKRQQDDI